MTEDQANWEAAMNLSPDSTRVAITCSKTERDAWSEEATENGFRSRSQYLYQLIQEARAYREHGVFADRSSTDRIDQLEAEVERLETALDRERQKQGGRIAVDDPAFLQQYLAETYTPLDELLQQIIESGALDDLLRKRVEDQLYYLAQHGTVEYEPGWGWRLTADATTDTADTEGNDG